MDNKNVIGKLSLHDLIMIKRAISHMDMIYDILHFPDDDLCQYYGQLHDNLDDIISCMLHDSISEVMFNNVRTEI